MRKKLHYTTCVFQDVDLGSTALWAAAQRFSDLAAIVLGAQTGSHKRARSSAVQMRAFYVLRCVLGLRGHTKECVKPMESMESTAAAYGVYADEIEVAEVVRTLRVAGFENDGICVVLAPTHPIAGIVRSAGVLTAVGGNIAATTGLIGWLSQLGAVVIPGVGFFIRSRAFFNALVMDGNAFPLRGNSRLLVGLGFSDRDAERFEKQLAQAGFLVYVASPGVARLRWAVELLRATGAEETATLEKVEDAGALA
jgi:hypothetical protein